MQPHPSEDLTTPIPLGRNRSRFAVFDTAAASNAGTLLHRLNQRGGCLHPEHRSRSYASKNLAPDIPFAPQPNASPADGAAIGHPSTAVAFLPQSAVFVRFLRLFRCLRHSLPHPVTTPSSAPNAAKKSSAYTAAILLLKGGQTRGRFLTSKFFVVRLHRLPPFRDRSATPAPPTAGDVALFRARESVRRPATDDGVAIFLSYVGCMCVRGGRGCYASANLFRRCEIKCALHVVFFYFDCCEWIRLKRHTCRRQEFTKGEKQQQQQQQTGKENLSQQTPVAHCGSRVPNFTPHLCGIGSSLKRAALPNKQHSRISFIRFAFAGKGCNVCDTKR
ncbi:hypothetical protein V9T40_013264 [Parthenolecanium corni]|uniref:Uncharacterized protein n=1 Tax=Parthenolecanium corni TaxID=536013 RepID=A0AAN9Y5X6_9HEMI